MLRFAISSASSNLFFFLKLLITGIFPFDRWRKLLRVRERQNYPARSPRWLARKIFFWPSSGTDFDFSGTRLVRKSAQGLLSPWNKLSRQKCRSPENIASSRLVAPGSPRMRRPVQITKLSWFWKRWTLNAKFSCIWLELTGISERDDFDVQQMYIIAMFSIKCKLFRAILSRVTQSWDNLHFLLNSIFFSLVVLDLVRTEHKIRGNFCHFPYALNIILKPSKIMAKQTWVWFDPPRQVYLTTVGSLLEALHSANRGFSGH